MLDVLGEANAAALSGLLGGIALGLAARIGRFCTLGAIEDMLYGGDDRRLRMWVIAIGVAIIGTHLAQAGGFFESAQSAYLERVWNPLGTIIGGLMFFESLKAIRRAKAPYKTLQRKKHGLVHALPLKMKFRTLGLYISVIPPVLVGVFVGILAGAVWRARCSHELSSCRGRAQPRGAAAWLRPL